MQHSVKVLWNSNKNTIWHQDITYWLFWAEADSGVALLVQDPTTLWFAVGRLSWWLMSRCHGDRRCQAVCKHVTLWLLISAKRWRSGPRLLTISAVDWHQWSDLLSVERHTLARNTTSTGCHYYTLHKMYQYWDNRWHGSLVLQQIIIIIMIILLTMFMVLPSWHSHCSRSSFDECRLSAGWLPTLRPNQPVWAVSPPKDWLLLSADTVAIYCGQIANCEIAKSNQLPNQQMQCCSHWPSDMQ